MRYTKLGKILRAFSLILVIFLLISIVPVNAYIIRHYYYPYRNSRWKNTSLTENPYRVLHRYNISRRFSQNYYHSFRTISYSNYSKTTNASSSYWRSSWGCYNECTFGEKRCNGNYLETCGNYDSDRCLEWPSGTVYGNYFSSGRKYCPYGCDPVKKECKSGYRSYSSPYRRTPQSSYWYRKYSWLYGNTQSGGKIREGGKGCKNDSDCEEGLRCVLGVGPLFGYGINDTVCVRVIEEGTAGRSYGSYSPYRRSYTPYSYRGSYYNYPPSIAGATKILYKEVSGNYEVIVYAHSHSLPGAAKACGEPALKAPTQHVNIKVYDRAQRKWIVELHIGIFYDTRAKLCTFIYDSASRICKKICDRDTYRIGNEIKKFLWIVPYQVSQKAIEVGLEAYKNIPQDAAPIAVGTTTGLLLCFLLYVSLSGFVFIVASPSG